MPFCHEDWMELRHLRYFICVAEEKSFSAASRKLLISQPSISQQIKDLESRVGTELFVRTKRRVELSGAGEAFLPEAREILRKCDDACNLARSTGTGWGRTGIRRAGT